MPTYQLCPPEVTALAALVLSRFETHLPLLDAKVRIDYLFAYGDRDEDTGEITGVAIKHHGQEALGLCRKLSLKDRAAGRGDAEILLDGDWWPKADDRERAALLDHELHHLAVKEGQTDDLRRPILKLRKHDVEVGWFTIVAARHEGYSLEQRQARQIMDEHGQYLWPDMVALAALPTARDRMIEQPTTIQDELAHAALARPRG